MTITTDKLAKILQTLFTTEADTAAKESGMIQRRRKISGAGFVQTLVFGWLEDPTTTVDELGDELNVSKQGLVSLGSILGVRVYPWGQTDLEFSPQEILNRSDPEAPLTPRLPEILNRSDPEAPDPEAPLTPRLPEAPPIGLTPRLPRGSPTPRLPEAP